MTNLTLSWSNFSLDLGLRTHIMGILNVTPDSFSDGGRYLEVNRAVEHALEMARKGVDIIDVGGESTRPFSQKISEKEEQDRVIPVIEALSRELDLPISIDTYKGSVARESLKAGASIINDISALRFDPRMASIAAEAGVPLILMHMKGTPQNMQEDPVYDNVVSEILAFLDSAIERARQAGVDENAVRGRIRHTGGRVALVHPGQPGAMERQTASHLRIRLQRIERGGRFSGRSGDPDPVQQSLSRG